MVSRVSMLTICTAYGCTTIVFGQGTCVEHDERYCFPIPDGDPDTQIAPSEHNPVMCKP